MTSYTLPAERTATAVAPNTAWLISSGDLRPSANEAST